MKNDDAELHSRIGARGREECCEYQKLKSDSDSFT